LLIEPVEVVRVLGGDDRGSTAGDALGSPKFQVAIRIKR